MSWKGTNMRVISLLMIIYMFFLSGCAKKSDNIYMGIEEKDVTETYVIRQTEEETTDNDYSIDKNDVKYFIDDSHFYDDAEGVDFAAFAEEEEDYHIRILNAFLSDDLEDFGDYYCQDAQKRELEERWNFCIEIHGSDPSDLTYMCIEVELTNNSNENKEICLRESMMLYTRVEDIRGKDFNLTDKRVDNYITPYTELMFDSDKKKDENKGMYFLLLSAGETITTKSVYIFDKRYSENELYICLHMDEGEENTKYNCIFPPTAKTTKFLKVNLQEK